MARRSLIPDAQRHQHGIQREFTVNGSALAMSVLVESAVGAGVATGPGVQPQS